ncbi:RNA polymerase sigma-70 factor (ECF subfamily) [Silvimonas terrae]|uniref:RNA polymerase sigma-70 factor (ECF subfamily) n=1 Tax=Silvimonas terrae TaxID=300266 RepID=A0A840RFJ6_9NEIS|nr:RNA polymerase sigma-70 factor [Silvimonas terrae]MBB5192329.1 RNA polymerase sigma-70 factor (ECF subfamily) [Silvimonas terrae]
MNAPALSFTALRPRLFAMAYRMTGMRADAEDILQDAWLRWHEADRTRIEIPEAWLTTVVTRLAIDRLREAKRRRADYIGQWLPEPLVEAAPEPLQQLEHVGELSLAFLTLLEKLSPWERAAFLLRESFELDYAEIAAMLGKSQAAIRQLVHRAKARLQDDSPRFEATPEAHLDLLQRFARASSRGDQAALMALLDENAIYSSDGGGKVMATLRPLYGAKRLVLFYACLVRLYAEKPVYYAIATVNGEPGLLRYNYGQLDCVMSVSHDGERIHAIHVVRNPDKLARIDPALSQLGPLVRLVE